MFHCFYLSSLSEEIVLYTGSSRCIWQGGEMVSRKAHNLEIVGSSPTSATNEPHAPLNDVYQ